MPTIELTGGPHDGLVQEIDPDFPDVIVHQPQPVSPGKPMLPASVYTLSCPAVTTATGRLKYIWVNPRDKGDVT